MASAFNKILHRRVRAEQSTHGQFHTQAARPGRELATQLQGPVYKYTLLMWCSKEASQVTSTWHEDKSTASLPSTTSETRAARLPWLWVQPISPLGARASLFGRARTEVRGHPLASPWEGAPRLKCSLNHGKRDSSR